MAAMEFRRLTKEAIFTGVWVPVMAVIPAIALTEAVGPSSCALRCWKLEPKCAVSSFPIFTRSALVVLCFLASSPKGKGEDLICLSYRSSSFWDQD